MFPQAAHGARMGQPLQLVVAKFTDGDYLKRLEGEGHGFSLRDSNSIHRKMVD